MPPPPRTYGKKRSFFGSLGSRHRSRASTDSLPAKNPDHGSPCVNTSYDTVKHSTRSQKNVQAASIDDIASALLDDSDSEMPAEEEAMQQSESGILDSPTSTAFASAAQVGEQRTSSYSPSTSKERTTSNSRGYRPGAPRVQKTSPNNFTKPSRPRGNSTASPKRKDYNLIRPLADPAKKTTNRSSYIVLKDSETVCLLPHNVMDGAPGILVQGDKASQGCAVPASADEIQEKVCAMLAATDALKPSPSQSQPKKSPASKVNRMTPSRMLAKVSSAWDRWQVKSSNTAAAAKPRAKLTKQPIRDDPNGPLTSHPVFHTPPVRRSSFIDTIEIRLNEGDNLNRRKVQQMVGGHVARKPVANDGKALRSGRSMDEDPFAEPAPYLRPGVVENRATMKLMLGPSVSSLLIIDPFEAEKGFESNLEDRILSSSPVCASTPRIHLHRVQTPTDGVNVDEHCSKGPTQMSLERMTTDSEYSSQEAGSFRKAADQEVQLRRLPNTDRIAVGFLRDAPSLDACHVKWSKKHPSPSKRDLEELEIAFRCYSELKRRGIGEEADELAAHYTPSARYLSPRDTNRLMRTREEDAKSVPACEAQSPARSHMRRPTDEVRRGQHIRLAPIYRPAVPHSDEIDELQ
ncbi:hypothetical protein BBK36DRAFT_1114556 [Trichoderma citrinoviride]|uniref:Uncharacterized protein n=1 Tax=Trichoderma citrinoviride TaxID=58853 RepID=A0A2T4BFE8_9HYPO|nr:hypothetical protein BBK36DRAFT_1114556 [Trichoderma citrinoviride]PTB68046.1 hypothetical protein BBK36DRAFT_1114556 [Trichoderma citrinoviride]